MTGATPVARRGRSLGLGSLVPTLLIATGGSILMYRQRNLPVDRACLLAIFGLAALVLLRNRRLVGLAVGFGLLTLCVDPIPPEGWLARSLRAYAESRVPALEHGRPRDFLDEIARIDRDHRVADELLIVDYALANLGWLATLVAARNALERRRDTFLAPARAPGRRGSSC